MKCARHLAPRHAVAVSRRLAPRRSGKTCRGAAVVEFVVVAPLFFLIVFGIIEFGRMVMVQQILTNASREGARRAVVEAATQAEVESHVTNYLASASIGGATVTITPSDLESAGFGDPVTVTVTVPFDSVSWMSSALYLQDTVLKASTVMQAERLQ